MIIKAELTFDRIGHFNVNFKNEMESLGSNFQDDYKLAEIYFFNLFCSRLFFVYNKINSPIKNRVIEKLLMCSLSTQKSQLSEVNILKEKARVTIKMVINQFGLKKFKVRGSGFSWFSKEIDEYNVESIGILYNYLVKRRNKDALFERCLSASSFTLSNYFLENNIINPDIAIKIAYDSVKVCK